MESAEQMGNGVNKRAKLDCTTADDRKEGVRAEICVFRGKRILLRFLAQMHLQLK